jgi:hypothetical protein
MPLKSLKIEILLGEKLLFVDRVLINVRIIRVTCISCVSRTCHMRVRDVFNTELVVSTCIHVFGRTCLNVSKI